MATAPPDRDPVTARGSHVGVDDVAGAPDDGVAAPRAVLRAGCSRALMVPVRTGGEVVGTGTSSGREP